MLEERIWADLRTIGAIVDPRKGDFDDPLAGVVHIRVADGLEVDIVVGRWKWQQGVIDRAELLNVGTITVRVPRTSDLILLKLAAGGILDLQDITALLAVSGSQQVVGEVEEHVHDLGADAAIA